MRRLTTRSACTTCALFLLLLLLLLHHLGLCRSSRAAAKCKELQNAKSFCKQLRGVPAHPTTTRHSAATGQYRCARRAQDLVPGVNTQPDLQKVEHILLGEARAWGRHYNEQGPLGPLWVWNSNHCSLQHLQTMPIILFMTITTLLCGQTYIAMTVVTTVALYQEQSRP